MNSSLCLLLGMLLGINLSSCNKNGLESPNPTPIKTNDVVISQSFVQLQANKANLILNFSQAVDRKSAIEACKVIDLQTAKLLNCDFQFSRQDSTLTIQLND